MILNSIKFFIYVSFFLIFNFRLWVKPRLISTDTKIQITLIDYFDVVPEKNDTSVDDLVKKANELIQECSFGKIISIQTTFCSSNSSFDIDPNVTFVESTIYSVLILRIFFTNGVNSISEIGKYNKYSMLVLITHSNN